MRFRSQIVGLAVSTGGLLLAFTPMASASGPSITVGPTTYTVGTPGLDGVVDGPYTTSQADLTAGQTQAPASQLFPTYTPATGLTSSSQLSNMSSLPGATKGTAPYRSGQAGTAGPDDGYCSSGGPAPETGAPLAEPTNTNLPMAPYYFPFITSNPSGGYTGYFDWRPKDTDEALVSATSPDGVNWTVTGEALGQNEGYCPDGDNNDNGQGHAYVMTVNGQTLLYTLNRVAGDQPGVGLLVHTLGTGSDPLTGLPQSQPVGGDPDSTTTSAASVPATSSGNTTTIPLASLGTAGTPTQIDAPGALQKFVDTTVTPTGTPAANATVTQDVITCNGTSGTSLTDCSATTAESVGNGDTIEQVVSTVTAGGAIPTGTASGGKKANEKGGLASLTISVPAATIATIEEANLGGGRVYIDGNPVYCEGDTVNSSSITLTYCTAPTGFTANTGDPVTLDPILPSGTSMTSGLVAPDGIVGTIPNDSAAPNGDTMIIYGEKILNFFVPTTTTGLVTLPAGASTINIPLASTSWIGSTYYSSPYYSGLAGFGSGASAVFTFGDEYNSSSPEFATVSCTGYTASPAQLTGCSTVTGNTGDQIASGSDLGIPGVAAAPYSALAQTGEGSAASPTALDGNNEDYTILQEAYTPDGYTFSNTGLANSGVISDTSEAPTGGTSSGYTGVNNPTATFSPSATSPYDNGQGSPEPYELRFTGTRGTVIQNSDGSYSMFLSGAWATDGDSDAFNQIFVTNSTDGVTWSVPQTVLSTDYTFSAREAQDSALASGNHVALNITGYYSGRAYGPTVVVNPTTGAITLLFAGYSTPKPLPKLQSGSLGTGTTQWTPGTADPALYRDILTDTLTPQPVSQTPESPLAVALPLSAIGLLGGGLVLMRRRRPSTVS